MILKPGYWILEHGTWQHYKWLVAALGDENAFKDAVIVELRPYHESKHNPLS